MEQFRTPIENKRFPVSQESLEQMKVMREVFSEIKEKYPEFVAMSFFGSRIIGNEGESSDIDAILYHYPGMVVSRAIAEIGKDATKDQFREWGKSWKKDIGEILDQRWQKYKSNSNARSTAYHVNQLEIGDETLDYFFEYFKTDSPENLEKEIPDWMLRIIVPFSLSIGDIGSIRRDIFERIEKQPNAEELYQKLIMYIQKLERTKETPSRPAGTTPAYKGFPKTLAEGKKYFLNEEKR